MSERYVGQLHSADDLIAAVEEYGFLPFFQNEIPGFSVEELCAPELWFADDADGPWEWKGPAARSGKCLYGKIFNKRAGFVSRDWIPDFANFRRDGYDFDARWDDGLTSYKDKELYETIADEGTVLSKRLKELRNYRKGGNTGFETCHCGFRLYAGQVRKTLWLGRCRVCDAGRAFRVRLYHVRLSARPAGIQRTYSETSAIASSQRRRKAA